MKNSFWMGLLTTALRGLIGAVVWSEVVKAVADIATTGLSGAEKRERVLADLRRAFVNVPTYLLNLAIEVAVTRAKS